MKKGRLYLIFAAFLLLAFMGATTFSTAESLCFGDTAGSDLAASNSSRIIKKTAPDWLAVVAG